MLLIVDNYDSFVLNIADWSPVDPADVRIQRNDEIDLTTLGDVTGVVISPGPMTPTEAGASNDLVKLMADRDVPVLGICLGHQCIGQVFGCTVAPYDEPMHGRSSEILLQPSPLFDGLPEVIEAGRYHSLIVRDDEHFSHEQLEVIARLNDGTIMGIAHRTKPIFGVQFHPESILTGSNGRTILQNFFRIATRETSAA